MTYKRNRLIYGIMIIIVMGLGLYSRKISGTLPHFLNEYLGDALWALMIYFMVAFIFSKKEIKVVALIGITFCYVIELSQFYHANWIDNIRRTRLGGLILGYVFVWSDLLAYAIGIAVGVIIELTYKKLRNE